MAKTMILKSIFIAYYASLIILSLAYLSKSDPSTDIGFTTDLIHRDSPQSPTYNPSLSPTQRLANSIRRSFHRVQHLAASKLSGGSPLADIVNSGGEYLMRYSVGTPPVPSLGVADTGSDVIWTQCQPCLQCFKQNLTLFAPRNSSTYQTIACNSARCSSSAGTSCSPTRKNCLYSAMYGDGSFSNGLLATDTITLSSDSSKDVSLPSATFGCGFRNGGLFNGGESGIVGLGRGKVSLIRQLGPLAQGKFSYCLVPLSNRSSKLSFGARAVVSGSGVVSTPLATKTLDTFYFLTLEGISVGNKRLDYFDQLSARDSREGNMIIDSGTTLTLLPSNLYEKLERELISSIALKRIEDPIRILGLCYFTRSNSIKHPPVTFHFKGANVRLNTENVFIRTSDVSLCLAAQPVSLSFGIYGNVAQVNFLVGYDLEKRTVSFRPTDCGKN